MSAASAQASDPLAALPDDWDFEDGRADYSTHRLHPWPGRFIPQIPGAAIRALTRAGEIVIDPFCGCGTTALEARLAGRAFYASDANPLATLITEAKCFPPGPRQRNDIVNWMESLRAIRPSGDLLELAPPIPNRDYWFTDNVAAQLAYLLRAIEEVGHSQSFLRVVFSSIITSVSQQESETRYRRVERTLSASDVLERFRTKLTKALRGAASMDAAPPAEGTIETRDARLTASFGPRDAALAVFSPPYPNSFDYHLYHRFRMFWLGFDPVAAKHLEIGAHLRYEPDEGPWQSDMRASLVQLAGMLQPGAFAVCVVGDGIIKRRVIPTASLLAEVALLAGFAPIRAHKRTIPLSRKSFKTTDGRLREESVVVLKRT